MRVPNSLTRSITRLTLAAGLIAGLHSAAAAQSPHVGARVGIDLDSRDLLLSTQVTIPMTSRLEFYPSIDVYLPDEGTRTGFNGDLKYRLPTQSGPELYVGGGMNVLLRNVNDQSDTDLGVKGLLGIETRTGWIHPFLEGRVLVHDDTRVQLIGGLNFTLGGR
ncbi:MAG TPA: hypothetical protein VLE53_13345 [Gemmatimonadaceae bacterium]|nr:hypothetical protein [Gemmatimonadaceae bacterium]